MFRNVCHWQATFFEHVGRSFADVPKVDTLVVSACRRESRGSFRTLRHAFLSCEELQSKTNKKKFLGKQVTAHVWTCGSLMCMLFGLCVPSYFSKRSTSALAYTFYSLFHVFAGPVRSYSRPFHSFACCVCFFIAHSDCVFNIIY